MWDQKNMTPLIVAHNITNPCIPAVFVLSALFSFSAHGGHGFYNSFATIEWLKSPGSTPENLFYSAEVFAEDFSLSRAKNLQARHKLSFEYAEEKLAESVSLFTRDRLSAADQSILLYFKYLDDSQQTALQLTTESPEIVQSLAERLLQHQYILSVEAIQFSEKSYIAAVQLNKAIKIRYETIIANTSRDFQDSHFFKKEEVKWSWETSSLPE
tara:strand:+ start:149 stop:787 length:639 start_codon:yes stop_codon:yes gene_type:complete